MTTHSNQNRFAVLKPIDTTRRMSYDPMTLSRSLGSLPVWTPFAALAVAAIWPQIVYAQTATGVDPIGALWRWAPFLITKGFLFNILISFLCLLLGTLGGLAIGLGQISHVKPLRWLCWGITQLFRNSPWLVLLFIVMLALPFELTIFGNTFFFPAWIKAVIGLSLPIIANISEIVRGAVASVPTTQWEAAESLAMTRRQAMWRIILPQCFKRMIPPWMNWYAILTMATPLVSILGVEEVVNLTRQAIEAEDNLPELLAPFYGFVLILFFIYCYPIARLTLRLERRFAVKL
ncbi:amino acid ABC transporter permease [Cognatishimia sp. SS12]|uniref:amino acid ABC transporter permease n=1 Tax=Cognatishimia sp. SS12 TaxID=2979465 RepID=UPI00232FBCA0|nr:amino acid ABC transporter permease [Cognatishimia sp. SS12]MDC0738296.1 amino acid ABC transporter permease [Cognatishimia sp. SS12]